MRRRILRNPVPFPAVYLCGIHCEFADSLRMTARYHFRYHFPAGVLILAFTHLAVALKMTRCDANESSRRKEAAKTAVWNKGRSSKEFSVAPRSRLKRGNYCNLRPEVREQFQRIITRHAAINRVPPTPAKKERPNTFYYTFKWYRNGFLSKAHPFESSK